MEQNGKADQEEVEVMSGYILLILGDLGMDGEELSSISLKRLDEEINSELTYALYLITKYRWGLQLARAFETGGELGVRRLLKKENDEDYLKPLLEAQELISFARAVQDRVTALMSQMAQGKSNQ